MSTRVKRRLQSLQLTERDENTAPRSLFIGNSEADAVDWISRNRKQTTTAIAVQTDNISVQKSTQTDPNITTYREMDASGALILLGTPVLRPIPNAEESPTMHWDITPIETGFPNESEAELIEDNMPSIAPRRLSLEEVSANKIVSQLTTLSRMLTKRATKTINVPGIPAKIYHSTPRETPEQSVSSGDGDPTVMILDLIDNNSFDLMIGVNAWKQYLQQKRARESRNANEFNMQLDLMGTAQLNYALCYFVKYHRGSNNSEIRIDIIYYMLLGIQMYLLGKGRTEDIFNDPSFSELGDIFDHFAKQHLKMTNYDWIMIKTVISERFLWATNQLGSCSPNALLNAMLYFNTKIFHMRTVEEHFNLTLEVAIEKFKLFKLQHCFDDKSPHIQEIYRLFKLYMQKRPFRFRRSGTFYLKPKYSMNGDPDIEYTKQCLSRKTIQQMLNRILLVEDIYIADFVYVN